MPICALAYQKYTQQPSVIHNFKYVHQYQLKFRTWTYVYTISNIYKPHRFILSIQHMQTKIIEDNSYSIYRSRIPKKKLDQTSTFQVKQKLGVHPINHAKYHGDINYNVRYTKIHIIIHYSKKALTFSFTSFKIFLSVAFYDFEVNLPSPLTLTFLP